MAEVDWVRVVMMLAALAPSIILHEVSHGVVALWFGDDTARRAGRLTLNPVRHVDPFGSVILPVVLAFSGLAVFGWAKPVPVRPAQLREPRSHSLYVSLVGPVVNIVLALLAAAVFRTFYDARTLALADALPLPAQFILSFGIVNVVLAAFNLLPLPPLDGSAMIERVLPERWWPAWLKLRRWSIGIVLVVVLAFPGGLSRVLDPALALWGSLL